MVDIVFVVIVRVIKKCHGLENSIKFVEIYKNFF